MSGVKHTPWEVEDFGCPDYLDGIRSRYAVRNESGEPIAYAFDADEARLFASVPDLLEALEQLLGNAEIARFHLKDTEEGMIVGSALFDTIQQARAAIARACGEQDGGRE